MIKAAYKVWSGFTKTLRAVVLKYTEDDLIIKTIYFGKFYVSKLTSSSESGQRMILYQPTPQLQTACANVIEDAHTIPHGKAYHFNTQDSLISKEVKLNMLSIAKVSNQPLTMVESVLQGLMTTLISLLDSETALGKARVKLNMKIGQLMIQNKNLQFTSESFSDLLRQKTSKTSNHLHKAVHSLRQQNVQLIKNTPDDNKSVFYDKRTSKIQVNADTLT